MGQPLLHWHQQFALKTTINNTHACTTPLRILYEIARSDKFPVYIVDKTSLTLLKLPVMFLGTGLFSHTEKLCNNHLLYKLSKRVGHDGP